jgi:hypothetical protein
VSRRDLMSERAGPLVLEAVAEGTAARLRCAGTADLVALEGLDAFLPKLHAELLSSQTTEVTVDLRELEFMNSSCFKSFISWIFMLEDLAPAEGYGISFLSNPNYHWQERSLHVLSSFAPDRVTIRRGEVEGTPGRARSGPEA